MSFTNESKNSVSYNPYIKAGQSLKYDNHLTYDALVDPISGSTVYYDTVGTTPSFTNESQNSTSFSNQAKS